MAFLLPIIAEALGDTVLAWLGTGLEVAETILAGDAVEGVAEFIEEAGTILENNAADLADWGAEGVATRESALGPILEAEADFAQAGQDLQLGGKYLRHANKFRHWLVGQGKKTSVLPKTKHGLPAEKEEDINPETAPPVKKRANTEGKARQPENPGGYSVLPPRPFGHRR